MSLDKKIRRAFKAQVDSSKQRGIVFNFTFEEWIKWWKQQLGPDWFKMRGKRKHQYCMARFKDEGPYEPGNIRCILSGANVSERKLIWGENHGMCKITIETARAIYMAEGSKIEIGRRFGVSRYTVSNIKSGSNWRHATKGLPCGKITKMKIVKRAPHRKRPLLLGVTL